MKAAKVYLFKGYNEEKVFGDQNSPEILVVVRNAASKEQAKQEATKLMEDMRVFAGKAFTKESQLEDFLGVYQRMGVRCVTVNIGVQAALGKLLMP